MSHVLKNGIIKRNVLSEHRDTLEYGIFQYKTGHLASQDIYKSQEV